MTTVSQFPIAEDSFLNAYAAAPGTYVDCYETQVAAGVSLEQFIEVFFDTWVFRLERRVLSLAGTKDTNFQAIQNLATRQADFFGAWRVEDRDERAVLLAVEGSPIRTFLAVQPLEQSTRLVFGSVLVPTSKARDGSPQVAAPLRAFIPLHRLYTRILLGSAARNWGADT